MKKKMHCVNEHLSAKNSRSVFASAHQCYFRDDVMWRNMSFDEKKIEKKVGHNRLSCQHKSTAVTTIWLQSSLNTLHIVTILQRCDNLGLLTRETKESGFLFFCSVRREYNRLIQNLSRNTLKLSLAEEMTRLHPIIRDLDLYWTGVTPLYIVSPQTQWHNSPITAH